MDFSPADKEISLMFSYDPHSASNIITLHALDPDKLRFIIETDEIDLRLTITENVDMRGLTSIDEDDKTKPLAAEYGNHIPE